jgi:hypothetical protein
MQSDLLSQLKELSNKLDTKTNNTDFMKELEST